MKQVKYSKRCEVSQVEYLLTVKIKNFFNGFYLVLAAFYVFIIFAIIRAILDYQK